jgi:hypothetical protein
MKCDVEGNGGNREVPSLSILGPRAASPSHRTLGWAWAEAYPEEEGGPWKRYPSWDDTTEPEAREV